MPLLLNGFAVNSKTNISPLVHHDYILSLINSSANYVKGNYDQQSENPLTACYDCSFASSLFDKLDVIIQSI